MKDRSIKSTVLSYSICFILLVILIEAIWGITTGVLIGANIGSSKTAQEEVDRILKENNIKETFTFKSDGEDWYKKLPPDVKERIQKVVNQKLHAINWFSITLAVSVFVFGTIGFLCGFLNRAFMPLGVLVILSFFVNNPVVRFPYVKGLVLQQKTIILLVQFGFCYLFGYLGTLVGINRIRNRQK